MKIKTSLKTPPHGNGKNRTVKGHLPQKVSRVCTLFMKKGGRIRRRATGRQRYSVDLRQGGLRVELRHSGIIFAWN